jgi:hypothetical protein
MDISMQVSRVSSAPFKTTATIAGEAVAATINRVEVELVDPAGKHGSWLLRFTRTADIDAATATYIEGGMVTVTVPDAPVA